jgi:transcriptional regulator with XRE-family HTH domain
MTEQTSFRRLLKHYRQAAGLSQEALAARAGLSARAISDLERGIYQRPRFDTLQLLLGALALPEP